ncbi:MAG: STT3 domain-containing protein, partial [Nanoarchaeota archaeon]
MVVDTMRYVPLGYNTDKELILHPYLIAWFHEIAVVVTTVLDKLLFFMNISQIESVTHSAVLYPAFMFGLTVIAFFLLVRKIFVNSMGKRKANIIALVSSFFLSVIPALLPRTIAGIPEKESAAFLFMFLAFYFLLWIFNSKKLKNQLILAILAGVSTAGMALIWGGYGYIFLAMAPTLFAAFMLGKLDRNKVYSYALWLITSFALMIPFSARYKPLNLLTSITTGSAIVVIFIFIAHNIIYKTRLRHYVGGGRFSKFPPRALSALVSLIVIGIAASVFISPTFVPDQIGEIVDNLVKPATSRLIQTVAENRQPYFKEWEASLGPHVRDIAITFWLFFFGSIYLFNHIIKPLRKNERWVLNFSYAFFLIAIIFSRYSSKSTLNGENGSSLFLYFLGFVVFVVVVGYYYYKYYRDGREDWLKELDFGLIFLFVFTFFSIISARAAVRLIMMLVPPASIVISYFAVASFSDARKVKDSVWKFISWAVVVLVIASTVFAGLTFYKGINASAGGHVPSAYTQQWQKSMAWVRENVREDAVFGHWWDYGYWLQSIGERATVLDGGNAISYWNHMMGRYALTGANNTEALEFLYAHNTTHFLIDSTDIGKYSAFSTIGSDVNYDRASFIPTFIRDLRQTQERKNSTVFVYAGGTGLDGDIIYEENGTKTFLPAGKAGLGAIIIEKDSPEG